VILEISQGALFRFFEANFSGHTTLARFSIVATIIVINSFMCCVLIQLPSSHRMPPIVAGEQNTN